MTNSEKTKTIVLAVKRTPKKATVDDREIKNVDHFMYVGSTVMSDLDCKKEISIRLAEDLANF